MFIPNTGSVLAITGSTAQCIAQPTEVAIPKKSQFVFNAIINFSNYKNSKFATMMRKFIPNKTSLGCSNFAIQMFI